MPQAMSKILSIIIPVFNEARTVKGVLERIAALDLGTWEKEIIVVDDGSTDGTAEILGCHSNFRLITHTVNRGKGRALKSGIGVSRGDAVLIQDADFEYDPQDIPRLLAALPEGGQGAVYGSRELEPHNRGYFYYVQGARVITACVNLLYGSRLTDVCTGYKLFWGFTARSLPFLSAGFEVEVEITAHLLGSRIPVCEIPISYHPRSFRAGKKIRGRDGLKCLWMLAQCRFSNPSPHV